MLPYRDAFLATNTDIDGLAVCGCYLGGDAIHVGLFFNSESEKKVIHFQNGNNIPLENISESKFESYLFNLVDDFPVSFLPSILALSELISQNRLNGFIFNRVGVIYNGGKFEYETGAYTAKLPVEKFINCGVFVLALVNTYNHQLVDWNSWPPVDPTNLAFLERWLNSHDIPKEHRLAYYEMVKEIRGRHILISPNATTKPAEYVETEDLSQQLIADIIQNA